LVEVEVDHPRLNLGDSVDRVDADDPIHPSEIKDPRAFERDRSSREPGSGSPRYEGHAKLCAGGDHAGDLGSTLEEKNSSRGGTMERETIAVVEREFSLVGQDSIGREERCDGVQPPSIVAFESAAPGLNLPVLANLRHSPSFCGEPIAVAPVESAV